MDGQLQPEAHAHPGIRSPRLETGGGRRRQMHLIKKLENLNKFAALIIGVGLVALVGYVDYVTGSEIGFSPFYLIPIAIVAWCAGARYGAAVSALSAAVWV